MHTLEIPQESETPFDELFLDGKIDPLPVTKENLSKLFYYSLALSAWKSLGNNRWSLRVNPSSGNLHPVESYLIAGEIEGLTDEATLYHYSPLDHGLEQRLSFTKEEWSALHASLPETAFFVGLSTIAWRESWKYGERAYRYCQLDTGHAAAALALSASMLGWKTRILEQATDEELSALFGLPSHIPDELETPECLIAVFPSAEAVDASALNAFQLPEDVIKRLASEKPHAGVANTLSPSHHAWPAVDDAIRQSRKEKACETLLRSDSERKTPLVNIRSEKMAEQVIRGRRSAIRMDEKTSLSKDLFLQMMKKLLLSNRPPFSLFVHQPLVHLALFIHRVDGLDSGLYLLFRNEEAVSRFKARSDGDFLWEQVESVNEPLHLYLLERENHEDLSQLISCQQDIAKSGAFSAGMIAEFEAPIANYGDWFYRRLLQEAGAIGQVLYLEAEAIGLSGTGLGCFFDDLVHRTLGLDGKAFQSLYHFTVGKAVKDERLMHFPPYHHLGSEES